MRWVIPLGYTRNASTTRIGTTRKDPPLFFPADVNRISAVAAM